MRLTSILPSIKVYEAVLYTPAEAVLAPYIDEVTSPAAKQWIATNLKNWLTKQPENLHKLPYLPANATEKQQKAFSFNDLYDLRLSHGTQMRIDHMLDYLKANPDLPRLERMSVDNVLAAADESVRRYNAQQAKQAKVEDKPKDIKVLMEFPGGYRMVEMLTQDALDREGNKMGHCVGQLHGCYLTDKSRRMFSLRDNNNDSYATIEVYSDSLRTTEIKGRQNAPPVRRYWPMLRQFIDEYAVAVDRDHQNIGLIKIPNAEGEEETMTQDQFRDMVLDPGNMRGQEMLKTYQENPRHFGSRSGYGSDASMGMFTALYGTDQLKNETVAEVFARDPHAAIQVVAHYGNRLTPEQLTTAFRHLGGGNYSEAGNNMKQLLQLTKPSAEVANNLLRQGLPERMGNAFVLALAQAQPQTYSEMISDPAAMDRELAAQSERSAAPFFAVPIDNVTPKMINKAFEYSPGAAIKRLKRDMPEIKSGLFLAAILGMATGGFAVRGTVRKEAVDPFIEYAKPSAAVVAKMFETLDRYSAQHHISDKGAYASALLMAVKKYVPEAMSKDTMEKALISIDQPDSYKEYLADDPKPSMAMQQKLLQKDTEDIARERYGPKHLQYLRSIDPTIYQDIYQTLKPKPFETTVTRVANGEKKVVPLDAKELTDKRAQAIRKAGKTFIAMFGGAVREPGDEADGFINPESPKAKEAEAAFHAMGKGALYNTAVNRINRKVLIHKSIGERYGHGRGDDELFAKHIADLPDKDIAHIIDQSGHEKRMFGVLVDHAPQRVPGVMASKSGTFGDKSGHYGKFNYPVNKDKAFEALEAVWASGLVPEGFKDRFTLAVFKRFKPAPAKLIQMLDRADSVDATRYVLKKTKKPSKELLNFVYQGWPQLLAEVPAEVVPDDLLVKLFGSNPKVITAMMDRDLRDFGTESRSKWAAKNFRKSIDREDPLYERYAKAAKAAGKEQEFATYVRQGELEALHPQLMPRHERGEKSINFDLLRQNLHEYSNRTLLEVAHADDSDQVIPLYFEEFTPEKLATLIQGGMIRRRYGYGHTYGSGSRDNYNVHIDKLDQQKLWQALAISLQDRNNHSVESLIDAMMDGKYPFTVNQMGALLNSSYSSKLDKVLARPDLNDEMKDWIADNKPEMIDDIRDPTPHVIEKLFDTYGTLTKDSKGNLVLDHHFAQAIQRWFNSDSYFFKYRANPKALHMLMAETRRRGGNAPLIFRTMLRTINELRTKAKGERYVSPVTHPIVQKVESAPEAVAA